MTVPSRVTSEIRAAAQAHGLSQSDILRGRSTKRAVRAKKQVAFSLRRLGYSLQEIAGFLNLHHSTVMRHLEKAPHADPWELPVPDLSGEWAI